VLVDGPDHGDHDRRPQHEEAPEDERVDQPRHEPLQQLALTEHDRRLVAGSPLEAAGSIDRRAGADEIDQELDAVDEQRPADPQGDAQRDRPDRDAYEPLTFLISAEIAGTTSCRSPTTP
jgi:hypothetical protein